MDSSSNLQDQKPPGSNHLQQKTNVCLPPQLSSNNNGGGVVNISGIGGGAVMLGASNSADQLHLPPPSPQLALNSMHNSNNTANLSGGLISGGLNTPNPTNTLGSINTGVIGGLANAIGNNQSMATGNFYGNSNNPLIQPTLQPTTLGPSNSDFDSDTELSIVAAAQAAAAAAAAVTNGYTSNLSNNSNNSNNLVTNNNSSASLNAKQQRQQKRRRERAQRLQAERDNRNATNTPNSLNNNNTTLTNTPNNNSQNQTYNNVTNNNITTTTITGNHLYQASSANSMGEDSNNSSGIFTTSSSSSSANNNALLPPTDSIASLLLNPPHSPDCHSGLMASPSDSEGESLDEDLLSTSSSSTLLLPRDKPPPRPPPPVRRKLPRSPVLEEEIIDGFAILEFKTYEDLEFAIKLGQKRKEKRLSALEELTCTYSIEEIKMPKIIETGQPHAVRGAIGGTASGGNGSIGGNMTNIGLVAGGISSLHINHNNHHHKDINNSLNDNNNVSNMRVTPINASILNISNNSNNNNITNNPNNINSVNSGHNNNNNMNMNINISGNDLMVDTDINMPSLTDSSTVGLKSTLATSSGTTLNSTTAMNSAITSLPWKDTLSAVPEFTNHNGSSGTNSLSNEPKILSAAGSGDIGNGNDSSILMDTCDVATPTLNVAPAKQTLSVPITAAGTNTITAKSSVGPTSNIAISMGGSYLKSSTAGSQNSNSRNSLAMDTSKANLLNNATNEKSTKSSSTMPLLASSTSLSQVTTTIATCMSTTTAPSPTLTLNTAPVTATVTSTHSTSTIPHTTPVVTVPPTTASAVNSSTLSTSSVDKMQTTLPASNAAAAPTALTATTAHLQLAPTPYSTISTISTTSSTLTSSNNSSTLLTYGSNNDAYKHNSIHPHPGLGPPSFKTMSSMVANCLPPGSFNKSNAHLTDQKMHNNNSNNNNSSNNDFIANMSASTAVLPPQQLPPTTGGQPTVMALNVTNQKDLHLLHHPPPPPPPSSHHQQHHNMSGGMSNALNAVHSKMHQQQLQQQHHHQQHLQHQQHLSHPHQHHMQHHQQQLQHQHHHQHLQHQQQLQHHAHHPHHHLQHSQQHQQQLQLQHHHKEMLSASANINNNNSSVSGNSTSISEHKDRLSDPNNRINNIGKGFNICDSGNDENKGSDKLGSIVFPSTPTQQISNATPSPTTPRKSSDYPQQATSTATSSSVTTSSTSSTTTPASSSIAAGSNLVQKSSANNEQSSAPPLPFSGPLPTSVVGGALSTTIASSTMPQSGSTTTGHPHSHVHMHPHDSRPPSTGGSTGLASNNNMMMTSSSLPAHSMFGPTPPPGHINIGGEKSGLLPPHPSHMAPVFSSSNQLPNDPRNNLTSPSSGPSPHSQNTSSDSPFVNKHIAGSPSPATGNLMSPAPLQSSQSNASPMQGVHQKSMHSSSQIPSNSPANMQLQSGAQIPPSSSGTNLMACPPGNFNAAGSISSRLGPPPPTHPFPSNLHSSTNSQQPLIMKQNEMENRDKNSHGGLVPPPIMNGYLPQFANSSSVGQHTHGSAPSRISPHANSMPSTATPPGPQGLPTTLQQQTQLPNQNQPQSSGASTCKPSSLSTPTSASFHSSALSSSMPTSHPPSSSTVTSIAKFANISSSSSGMPPMQIFPGGLPPGLPPGVAPPGMMPSGIPPNGITPMLLHSSPYRPPYPNYPLYAPYSGLPHSPYLPPAVPSPSASPRTSRESPMMQQMSKPPSLRPPTPVSQSSNSVHAPGPMGNSGSASNTPTSSIPTTVPTSTTVASSAASLSQHGLPHPTSSMTPHILHHPHLGYAQSLQMQQQILGGPMPPSHHQPLVTGLLPHSSVSHSAHSIASVTTITSASTPLSAAISGGTSGLSTSSPLAKDGTQLLVPPHPHLLGHPHLAPPHMPPLPPHMLPPHPALLRGASPTTPISSSNANSQPSSIGTTAATSSTSVIHKGVSPQIESPSKERNDSNAAYLPRSSTANSHLNGGHTLTATSASSSSSPYIPTCGASPLPIPHSAASLAISSNASYSSTVSLPTTTHASGVMPMMATQLHQPPPGSLQYAPGPKGPPSMWPPPSSPSVSIQPPPVSVTTTHSSSSMATRPTPPPPTSSVGGLAPPISVSPHTPTLHSSSGIPSTGIPPGSAGFHPQYFVSPMPPHPPVSSSAPPPNSLSSSNSASSASVSSSIVTSAAISAPVTTTTQSSAPHPFSAESLFQPSKNDQADLLRRELDNRFLDRSGLAAPPPTQQTAHQQAPTSISATQPGAPSASPSSSSSGPPTSTPGGIGPPTGASPHIPTATVSSPYLRQELHHHQHQHTHLHQHQQLLPTALASAPPPAPAPLFPPPLFKDIPKISAVESPFYRTGIGLPGYTGYSPAGLIHPGLGGATPFMPPSHLTSFAPKTIQPTISTNPQQQPQPPLPTNIVDSSSKSIKFTKTGRWNAMHVRIAWEIYYHQNKQNPDKLAAAAANNSASSGNSTPGAPLSSGNASGTSTATISQASTVSSNLGAGPSPSAVSAMSMKVSPALALSAAASPHLLHRPGELPPGAAYATAMPGRSPFENSPLSASFIGAPPSHIGTAVSPFGRYVGPFGFGLSPFAREIPLGGGLHDPWRTAALQRTVPYHPAGPPPGWPMKPDTTALDNARREAEEREREREMREREQRERDRQRQREREERERKEKEEKLKREQQEREIRERERERERKERERREMERREMERERMLQQQRINESNKLSQAAAAAAAMNSARERSPHRSVTDMQSGPGGPGGVEMRIKEEMPRTKEEQDAIMMRASAAAAAADPRYQHQLAQAQANAAAAAHHASFMASRHGPHGVPPPPHLARQMMPPSMGGPPLSHFGPTGPPGWPMDPYRDPYGMSALRYNPLMEVALRHEEERHKAAMSMYAVQSAAHLRGKEPSPIPPPSGGVGSLGPPPPPHHRMQPGQMGQPQQGPPPSLGGKPPTMGGMPHPMVIDPMLAPKKEEPGVPSAGVMSMAPPQPAPQNAQPGR